jgi:hypothetical protein
VKQTLSNPASASAVFQLERNHKYQFTARAKDSEWHLGRLVERHRVQPGRVPREDYAGDPTYSGTWTRSYWQPASDRYVAVASGAGATATFSFTGSNVAWIATKSTNRGQADVLVDGAYVETVDLYSSSTPTAQFVAYSGTLPYGTHKLTIIVRGTAGHRKVDVDAFVRLQ